MFQYLLAFLLFHSYYQSLGNPIQTNLISYSFNTLSNSCGNIHLSAAIKQKTNDCSLAVTTQLYNQKQIRCLMFYDINKQLCSAVAASKLVLPEDFEKKAAVPQDIYTVCNFAKDWNFTNIVEYPFYKNTTEGLIKSPFTCGEICGAENTVNEANEYCKYYKLGIETLQSTKATPGNNVINNVVAPPVQSEDSNQKADIAVLNVKTPVKNPNNEGQIKHTETSVVKSTSKNVEDRQEENQAPIEQVVSKPTQVEGNVLSSVKNDEQYNNGDILMEKPSVKVDLSNKSTVSSDVKPNEVASVLTEPEKAPAPNVDTNKDGGKVDDPEDYGSDVDGNDLTEGDAEDTGVDAKPALAGKQDNSVRTLTPPHNRESDMKDFYPNSDTFPEDDDHFFPFFLTAIILVVLLYVLYHNKNKVGKVFFGLILEGRQGRRRNSRGHAYRRLDTLEQAMNANTAAPPSKIIY